MQIDGGDGRIRQAAEGGLGEGVHVGVDLAHSAAMARAGRQLRPCRHRLLLVRDVIGHPDFDLVVDDDYPLLAVPRR